MVYCSTCGKAAPETQTVCTSCCASFPAAVQTISPPVPPITQELLNVLLSLASQLNTSEWRYLRCIRHFGGPSFPLFKDGWVDSSESRAETDSLKKLGLIEVQIGRCNDDPPSVLYKQRITEKGRLLLQVSGDIQTKKESEWEEIRTQVCNSFFARIQPIVDKFVEIAERKVSVRDEYGDENWDALPAEVAVCKRKIESAEQHTVFPFPLSLERLMSGLYEYLRKVFKEHHEIYKKAAGIADFDAMSGTDFETYIAKLLMQRGFTDVRGTPATGDQGADLIVKEGKRTIVIQTKRWDQPVANSAIQQVVAALSYYKGTEAWVITNSRFTVSARALAVANNVRLIDGGALQKISRG